MTNYLFPALTSSYPVYPINEEIEDGTIRTNSEAGRVVTRSRDNRFGRKTWKISYEYISTIDKETIEYFIQNVQCGARSFYWGNQSVDINNPIVAESFNGTVVSSVVPGWTIYSAGSPGTLVYQNNGIVSGFCGQFWTTATSWAFYKTLTLTVGKQYAFGFYIKTGDLVNKIFYCGILDPNLLVWLKQISGQQTSSWTYYADVWNATQTSVHLWMSVNPEVGKYVYFDKVSVIESPKEVRFVELPKFSYILNGYWNCEFAIKEV